MMIAARNAFLMSGGGQTPWVNPYITDGLVAMWDGEWNAGGGVHDPDATSIADIIGTNDLQVPNGYSAPTIGPNCFSFANNAQRVTASLGARSTRQPSTIEVCFRTSVLGGNNIVFSAAFNNATTSARYYSNRIYTVNPSGNFTESSGLGTLSVCQAAAPGSSNAGTCLIYFNASLKITAGTWGIWCVPLVLGTHDIYSGAHFEGDIYCCRIYDKQLTAAEVVANHAVDAARFGL